MKTREIKLAAKENLKGRFGTSLFAEIAEGALLGLASLIPPGAMLVSGAFDVGLANIYMKGSEHEDVEVKDLFSGFRKNLGENFLAGLLRAFFLLLWTLLFIIPAIVKSYSYAMTSYIMARETDITAIDAITKSRNLMNGHKWELFVLQLSFIGWYWLNIVTLGLACFYTVPYINAAKAEFFKRVYENA